MRRVVSVLAVLGLVACSKGSPSDVGAAGQPEAAAAPSSSAAAAASVPSPQLAGSIAVKGNINSTMAEALATRWATQHWPQYHVRMGAARRVSTYYWVVLEFQEDNVGGHVIVDFSGNVMDAGTSRGEH